MELQEAENYRAGVIASVVASTATGKQFKPDDFFHFTQKKQSVEEQVHLVELLSSTLGGELKKNDK